MGQWDYLVVDFDTHYYEPLDACTRFLDERIRKERRGVQIVEEGRRKFAVVGGRLTNFVPNITFDPVAAPGSLEAYFRGDALGKAFKDMAQVERLRPEYQQGEPRRRVMEQQGVEASVLLPTFGCGLEELLAHDLEASRATLHAFNRWLLDEFGFTGPTVAAPLISLSDVDAAFAEVEWVLSEGARVLLMLPGPVRLPGDHRTSPTNPRFDRVWQLINDTGITVAYHTADAGYFRYFRDYDDPPVMDSFSRDMLLGSLWAVDRPMQDMLGVMVLRRFFERFPNLRIVSIEQGSDWLHVLLDKLHKLYKRRPQIFAEPPADTIRRHVWMCPFWEDDIDALVDAVGVDHVVFGSDWPHPEGVTEPRDFVGYLDGMDDTTIRRIMRENATDLLTLQPSA